RLVRNLERGRRRLLLLLLLLLLLGLLRRVRDLDPAAFELVPDRVGLERIELMRLYEVGNVGLANRARAFSVLQQSLDVLVLEDRLDLDRHLLGGSCLWARDAKHA